MTAEDVTVGSPQNPNPGAAEAAAERRLQALELRKNGMSYRAIGRALGVSHAQAARDINAELAELALLRKDKAEELQELELERLDAAICKITDSDGYATGDPQSIATLIRLSESRRKLLGLDSAQKSDMNIGGQKDNPVQVKTISQYAGLSTEALQQIRDILKAEQEAQDGEED